MPIRFGIPPLFLLLIVSAFAAPAPLERGIPRAGAPERSSTSIGHTTAQIAADNPAAHLEQAVIANPNRPGPRLELGAFLLNAGDPQRARDHLEIAVALNDSNAEGRRLLGLAHFRMGNLGPAISEFEQAVMLSPLDGRLHLILTDVLMLAGLEGEAEEAALRGVETLPDFQDVHYNLADLYAKSGRLRRSLEGFERAIRLDGTIEADRLYERIGEAHTALGQLPEATSAFENAIRINPDNVGAQLGLASVYLRDGRFEAALDKYSELRRRSPDHLATLLGLAEVNSRLGRFTEARDAAAALLAVAPDDRRARYLLGSALLRLGRAEEGRAELDEFRRLEAQALAAEHAELEVLSFNRNAVALVRQGRYQEAIALLSAAAATRPDAASLFMNLALIQSETGAHLAAADTFESMIDLGFGADPTIHRYLAREYQILGEVEASQTHQRIYQNLTTQTDPGTTP